MVHSPRPKKKRLQMINQHLVVTPRVRQLGANIGHYGNYYCYY